MGLLLILLFVIGLTVAAALGATADSREPGHWYPAGPDRDFNVHGSHEGITILRAATREEY
jgi:hypothetical protein